jgi:hypothetical protein
MKPNFYKSSGRLRGKSWAFLLGLVLPVFAAQATGSLYSNSGTINNANLPNVDATNFYNSGTWNIFTAVPYETAHTLNYTNVGTMTGSVGWEFDFGPLPLGGRGMSANFVNNSATATIQANDGTVINPIYAGFLGSYLLISATNIVNKGTLIVGASGEIVLNGANVTLSRSALEITPFAGHGSSNSTTNFTPDVNLRSMFWGTNDTMLDSSALWDGTNVFMSGTNSAPFSFLVDGNYFDIPSYSNLTNVNSVINQNTACGSSDITVQIVPFAAAVGSDSMNIVVTVTNVPGTNSQGLSFTVTSLPVQIIRQAVFLNLNADSGIVGQVRFSPSPDPTNYAQTVAVRLSATSTNVITLSPQTSSIYLVDTKVSETNYGLVPSDEGYNPYYFCFTPVVRPVNYIVERTDAGNYFAGGFPGDGLPPNNFFYSIIGPPGIELLQANVFYYTNLISNIVPANYTGYANNIDNLSSDQQSGGAVTNLGGRIILNANNLDLTRADLVAGGYVRIQASNLVSSANAVVSCQYLSYNLGSTNGNLNFTNLASQSIPQFQGNIVAWSATWTNFTTQVISNYVYDTNNTPAATPAFVTNTTEIDFYVLVVDASSLSDQVPVSVQDLILHSTNIVVSDSVTVANSLLFDGQNLTLLGEMDLSGAIQNWTGANAPNLLYFTNNGYLYIPNDAHFGDDTAVPYKEFVNSGTGGIGSSLSGIIFSADQTIDSLDLQIAEGINYTYIGDFSATAGSIEITGPPAYSGFPYSIYSAQDIQFFANTLLIDSAALYASGALDFNVTGSLSDNGTASTFTCYNGFNLWIKPNTGDLLGSTITSIASVDAEEIDHAWTGNDYGPVAAGFANNVAIGTLVLSAQNPHFDNYRLEPLFHFYGTGGSSSNAMYVYMLDLSGLTANSTDVANMIQIDPGMKIYFYGVNLGFTPPANQAPEQFLQAQFPGQMVAVPKPPVSVAIDAQANVHAISPMIYGVAFATSNQLADLNFTINRSGGNAETRYNWQLNAHNRASDWYFESLDDGSAIPGATADDFVANSKNGGAQPMITIPMIGWMPKLGPGRSPLWSYSIAKYGPQTDNDSHNGQWSHLDAGNGISVTNDTPITWNDPTDANFSTNSAFQRPYVQHLINHWGSSTNGGVRYYVMDNEHSLWPWTHQDVHPVGPAMGEIRADMLTYASMVKSNDPNALICGPEEWGWNGYLYSGFDQQWSGKHNDYDTADYPDRKANGGWDYIPWLLKQFSQYSATNSNKRLLDYVTVHCYPQEASVSGSAVDSATELLRNQSTRVFWDTNYTDHSWINSVIALIPRLKIWVATNYPGTKIGITEYNWGAEADINGATAQADILGIFASQGLDLATRWTTPDPSTPTYLAMKLYRNYDGNKSTFGNNSVAVTVPDPDSLSAFAAIRTNDNALTIMAVNKAVGLTPISLNITNFGGNGIAQAWQLTAANVITHLANVTLTNGVLSAMLPSQSVTLFVLPIASPFSLQTATKGSAGQMSFSLAGLAGQTYVLQSSTDLFHWVGVSTNTLVSNSFPYLVTTTNKAKFYRGLFMPP